MTDQPIEPREQDDEPNPSTTTPHPDPQPDGDDPAPANEAVGTPTPSKVKAEGWSHALDGSDVGSDTRAGSLSGGSASGSERDPAQIASNRRLAEIGPGLRAQEKGGDSPEGSPNSGVTNTGAPREQAKAPGNQADPATS